MTASLTLANMHKKLKTEHSNCHCKAISKRDFMRLLMDPILDKFYVIIMEFFVTDLQTLLLVKHLHAATWSEEKWLFSQAIQNKTPVKCLGEMGGFGIDWYTVY